MGGGGGRYLLRELDIVPFKFHCKSKSSGISWDPNSIGAFLVSAHCLVLGYTALPILIYFSLVQLNSRICSH